MYGFAWGLCFGNILRSVSRVGWRPRLLKQPVDRTGTVTTSSHSNIHPPSQLCSTKTVERLVDETAVQLIDVIASQRTVRAQNRSMLH